MNVEIQKAGIDVGRHRVARLIRDNKLKALQKWRYKRTTDSNHAGLIAHNLLDQDFACTGPDQKWGVDISYIWTAEGWLGVTPKWVYVSLGLRREPGEVTNKKL
ncbi:transposase InsO family protein [Paenochrobactrum gallinarii]|uniref:Transposase InsO family protein n=1 Tax=Paenochrobactrum gallinarii TaxID=643673 RepID=A0A841MA49_9HYPH|nr:transposase InsO family protein [Paenochrobactrum gallinarii]